MDSMTVQSIIDAVTFEAGIDGQVSSTGRYTTTSLTNLFNRTHSSLRSMVSGYGHKHFLNETVAAALPAQTSGEEYIVIPYPTVNTTQAPPEVHGVDVFTNGTWEDLYPVDFELRRTVVHSQDVCIGYWAIKKWPEENGTGVTAGEIAVFPPNLTGNYKIWYLKPWIPLSNTSHIVLGQPDWFTWTISDMVMTCVGSRDNNKKGTYNSAFNKKADAERRIKDLAKRVQRAGPVVPRRKDGWDSIL